MGRGRKLTEFKPQQIAYPISEAERSLKGKALADMCGEIDKLRADAADAAGIARKKIRALDKERRLLAECVRTGNEMRDAQLELAPKTKLTAAK